MRFESAYRFTFATLAIMLFCTNHAQAGKPKGCGEFRSKTGIFIAAKQPKAVKDGAFSNIYGDQIKLSSLKGKALLVNFWASWCPPCIKEMPSMDRLQGRFAHDKLLILPLIRDPGGTKTAIKFYHKQGIKNLPPLADRWGKLTKPNRIGALPVTMFVNKKGDEVGRLIGGVDWESQSILKLLDDCLEVGASK